MSIQDKLAAIEARLGKASSTMDDEDIVILYQNLDTVVDFKDNVCSKSKKIDATEEQDWFSISLGFFIAKGVVGSTFPANDPDFEDPESEDEDEEDDYDEDDDNDQEQIEFLDAHTLACKVRYTYHYWC